MLLRKIAFKKWIALTWTIAALTACGSGGGAGIAPPSGLSYPSPAASVIGTQLVLRPTVAGDVTNFAISPALPSGLAISSVSGIIFGTPIAISAAMNYTVTASNNGGSAQAVVSIEIDDIAPIIGYGAAARIEYTSGLTSNPLIPTASGGPVVTWSITPALPNGLNLSASTGVISGTPLADSASSRYIVTAINSGGQSTKELTIEVSSGVLLELGHVTGIATLRQTASRVLSADFAAHWNLQDYVTASLLATGDGSCLTASCGLNGAAQVDLAGQTFVIETSSGLEVRAAVDGSLLSTIPGPATWWKLAADGTYVSVGSTNGIAIYSTSGQALVSESGDFSTAAAYAASGQLQIAQGPAGMNVVQTISVPSGTSSVSPAFSGQFNSWFLDGARFITNVGSSIWIYSSAGAQQQLASLPSISGLAGNGTWFWTLDSGTTLSIYAVGTSAPAAIFTFANGPVAVSASGPTIGVLGYPTTSVVDLSGGVPLRTDYSPAIAYISAFSAVSASQWLVGNRDGVTLDGASLSGPTRFFSLGRVFSIAGGGNRTAIATASGSILVMAPQAQTTQLVIPFGSSKVQLSSDGAVLVAMGNANDAQFGPDRSLKVFSLPSGNEIFDWSYVVGGNPTLADFNLSASGSVIAQVLNSTRQVTPATGGPIIWSDSLGALFDPPPVQLSADGTLIAATNGNPNEFDGAVPSATNIYKSGTLVEAVAGWSPGWIDNARLLVNTYAVNNHQTDYVFTGSSIYSASGTLLSSPPLPDLRAIQTVSTDSVYSMALNTIVSLTTGNAVWMSANTMQNQNIYGAGAATNSYIVFPSGTKVLAQPQ